MLSESVLFNHGGHNRAPGQAGGRATEGWPRRGETSGSERVKEHGAEEEVFHDFFRQDDKFEAERRTPARQRTDLRVRQMCSPEWATEAQRRKTAEGSPKGERSESI